MISFSGFMFVVSNDGEDGGVGEGCVGNSDCGVVVGNCKSRW